MLRAVQYARRPVFFLSGSGRTLFSSPLRLKVSIGCVSVFVCVFVYLCVCVCVGKREIETYCV